MCLQLNIQQNKVFVTNLEVINQLANLSEDLEVFKPKTGYLCCIKR